MLQSLSLLPAHLRSLLGLTTEGPTKGQTRFWFVFALLYAAVCAGLALRQAFAADYVLADDVRQHIFWMFRFLDPKTFPGDSIADYFQSIAPPGFAALYYILARAGLDPLLASKLIPPALGLLCVGYFFALSLRVARSPVVAALASIILCQSLWLSSDLCSATPRAFFYPLFTAFLYYQVRGFRLAVLIAVLLEVLFFPPAALLSLGVLGLTLVRWEKRRLRIAVGSLDALILLGAFVLTLVVSLIYLRASGEFGPLVSFAQAREMAEFGPEGRMPFFYDSLWTYWVKGAGGLHIHSRPNWLFAAFLWPILRVFPNRFPLMNRVAPGTRPLPQVIGSALVLFGAAHLFLFRLYLPSRYTQHGSRIVFALAAGVVIVALVDALLRWGEKRGPASALLAAFGAIVLLVPMVCYPAGLANFPHAGYVVGGAPNLYRFFSAQPQTARIASLADEANNLPTFCRRSIVVGIETAVPFHLGYYLPLRERAREITRAQYSADLAVVQKCIRAQRIDYWLLDRGAFTPGYVAVNRMMHQMEGNVVQLAGEKPYLEHPPAKCVAFADEHFVVLDARRLLALPGTRPRKIAR